MQNVLTFYNYKRRFYRFGIQLLTCLSICAFTANAQICPPNIDFENGTFSGWTCYTGSVSGASNQNVISLIPQTGPVAGRHTMYSSFPGDGVDPYGGFPVNCPNGSGHSVKLGNDLGGTEAEGLSYEFTIPANQNDYALIYYYAVIFQDPNHLIFQQPRMEIEITNVTDNNTIINCSSFTFIPYGSLLPGFFESPNPGNDGSPVWCKDWSRVSVNLSGLAGKTIRLLFKTADCTFRRHFGYAYIDINSECNSEFLGATYCRDDSLVNVVAPYGYQNYTWYDIGFSQVLGNQQTLTLNPPPLAGTTYAVELVPYFGYGCLDTLYARLMDTLTIIPYAGPNAAYCNDHPVQLGAISRPGVVYNWTPASGLNDPTIANPIASPAISTLYVLETRHDGGGCRSSDTVFVTSSAIDNTLQLIGKEMYCQDYGDSSILKVKPTDYIQWFKDDQPIGGATQPDYRVVQTGSYYAKLHNNAGCSTTTVRKEIIIDIAKPGILYPLQYAVIDLPLDLEARQFGSSALWKPPAHLNNPSSYTPVFTSSTDQLYTIEIKTISGCLTVDTQLVKTVSHIDIYVPGAFTPNNDGLNDKLFPTLFGIKALHYFKVYNRWGQLLFETKNIGLKWDGNHKGLVQGTQVVVWMAAGIGVDGKIYMRKGTTVLIR